MKRLLCSLLFFASLAFAQLTPPSGGGGGGSGTVTGVATGCGTSGGTITTTGTIIAAETLNSQTGTTYTFLNGDCGKLVSLANASAIAVTLPQANGSTFVAKWFVDVQNTGAGTATITPTTSTIDGHATLALTTNQGARIVSDGTNYYTERGGAGTSGGGGGTIPSTTSALKGDGSGNAAAVTGTGSNCVHVDGTSATCGGGGGTFTLIQTQTLSMAANTVTFSSIPATYANLVLYVNAACDGSTGFAGIYIQLNGDTAADYVRVNLVNNGTVAGFNQTGAQVSIGDIPCATATAGSVGSFTAVFADYLNTTFWKNVTTYGGFIFGASAGSYYQENAFYNWQSTAAINSITLGNQSNNAYNFVTGSTFSLYGF